LRLPFERFFVLAFMVILPIHRRLHLYTISPQRKLHIAKAGHGDLNSPRASTLTRDAWGSAVNQVHRRRRDRRRQVEPDPLSSGALRLHPFYESNDDNPFLADFYRDMSAFAFPAQVWFLARKFKAHREIGHFDLPAVLDRTIYEDAEVSPRTSPNAASSAARVRNLSHALPHRPRRAAAAKAADLPQVVGAQRRRIALRGRAMETGSTRYHGSQPSTAGGSPAGRPSRAGHRPTAWISSRPRAPGRRDPDGAAPDLHRSLGFVVVPWWT
jgi:hypothetical protein